MENTLNQEVQELKMAAKDIFESLTEEVVCPICLDFFTDPVTLECGHNFCRSCITRSWDREVRNSCPECREQFVDRTLRVNRALARLSEKARTLSLCRTEKESKHHCEKHLEELKLFCETDKKVICLICRDAREHKSHSFIPIEEAVEIYKEESHNLQSQITSQFSELHQIFTEKERRVLADIREEEMKIRNAMEKRLEEIQANLNSIQKELSTLQEQIGQKDNRIFLKEATGRRRRVSDEINSLSMTDGALPIENFHHHFVLNTLWRETCAIQRVSVTLDVETAHARLEVSVDRKRVRWTRTKRGLPDTRNRFTDWPCVLGSEGFTSGRHYWEVEVEGSRYWCLGVAAESVERKGPVPLTPETGVWRIRRFDDEFDAFTSPLSRLPARPIPGRVGVYFSYESGTISFYDADTKSHLHTFTGNKFTEKLYPFFGPWDKNRWLRICSGSV
ncbi:E3 ubiquitin-protein ligase TRIM39-like isoform X2 [Leucoraja erinacea]|uniref:E3 ubiquitin-protein ligase TRIM39-like isoform X2 n=1 Tax=Leucoraja erinaceus TaxID=7782 RepID=UPI00245911FA|nr:E3 ubiquitin-protein ligase TRIM39-like isoform X2 [Leucoraja erinacea]